MKYEQAPGNPSIGIPVPFNVTPEKRLTPDRDRTEYTTNLAFPSWSLEGDENA